MAAPAPSASSFPRATSRARGTIPQLVHGKRCCSGTNLSAERMTRATSSGVSTRVVATSMHPTSTSLPASNASNSIGTRELAHSSETWSMEDFASSGKVCSYWRHSLPSVFFQTMLASIP